MRALIKTALFFLNAVLHRDTSPKVVFYHDIGTTYTPMGTLEPLFWSHMAYLQELKEKIRSTTTTSNYTYHTVAFDDGFRGIWDNRESMRLFDVHPIVFIAIDLVGKPGYLTWDEIRTLQNDYGVNFQCHTWSHQTLIGPVNTDLPPPTTPNFRTDAWYHHELVDSKNELERQLNLSTSTSDLNPQPSSPCSTRSPRPKIIDSLCFPVGYFSDVVIQRCAAAGYTNLYASFPGNLKDDTNSIVDLDLLSRPDAACRIVPRILCQDLPLFAFKCVLHGGMNPLRKRYVKRHYILNIGA